MTLHPKHVLLIQYKFQTHRVVSEIYISFIIFIIITIIIPKFNGDRFGVDTKKHGDHFRGRDHFGVDLGVMSGLGAILGSGSFRRLYRSLWYCMMTINR